MTYIDCRDESVDVAAVLAVMRGNTEKAKRLLTGLTEHLSAVSRTPSPDGIETVLDTAVVTPPVSRDPEFIARLTAIAPRVF